jgi:cell division septation protein DedD
MKRICVQCAALLLVGASCAAIAGPVLTVDSASGPVGAERLGTQLQLKSGDTLAERDLLKVGAGGRLTLILAGHGFMELGPGTEVAIEKLPFASYADDLQTMFSLTHGYLRVVWKVPPQTGGWPLFVYFGNQHATLNSGEYFFDDQSGAARSCVASGRLSVVPKTGGELQDLRASACYRFVGGREPERVGRDPSSWIAVRRGFNVDAPTSPEAMLAARDADDDAPAGAADVSAASLAPKVTISSLPPIPPPQPEPARPTAAPPRPVAPPPMAALAPPAAPPQPAPAISAPAPVAASPAATTAQMPGGSGEWGINIASYPVADDARKHAQQLRSAGYSATVQQALVKRQTWYRVQLRGYPSADAARAIAAELQARFSYQGLWVNRTGPADTLSP